MKTVRHLLATLALTATAFAADPLPIAVFDFQAGDRALEKKGAEVGLLLNVLLSTQPDVFLVERQEVEKLLGEQEFGLSGTVSADTAAKVGALVGAKVLVTGRVFESGGKAYLVAKVMGTETGRVFGEMATTPDLGELEAPVAALAEKIAATVAKQSAALVAQVEPPEARLERLKKIVSGKKLPAVLVSIPEQHLARPVIDPAAQTEIMKTLAEVGFEVVTAAEVAGRTDVATITGEAFSEFGLRRGNLVSCRARIEIVMKDASGKLLATDRQMDVAVDIAEHVAGKKALESAALKLANRLVPALAR
ncbi:MAG: curli assembly protein CsgG [Burkholderiales bacterium]|nr:curli assembly protein CsgG [Opitutaceae bacterium]